MARAGRRRRERVLRLPELEMNYESAWQEWQASGDVMIQLDDALRLHLQV